VGWGRVFCDGLSPRPFRVGTLPCSPSATSYLSSLPLSYPSLFQCRCLLCTGCAWTLGVLSPAVGLHGPAFPDAVTSAVNKMICTECAWCEWTANADREAARDCISATRVERLALRPKGGLLAHGMVLVAACACDQRCATVSILAFALALVKSRHALRDVATAW
jgi:hypothetical protein